MKKKKLFGLIGGGIIFACLIIFLYFNNKAGKGCNYYNETTQKRTTKSIQGLEKITYKYYKDEEYIYQFNLGMCTDSIPAECTRCSLVETDVDVESFELLDSSYIRDKNNIYYNGKIIEGVDRDSFEMVSSLEAKDSIGYIYMGKRYYKDVEKIFFDGKSTGYKKYQNQIFYHEGTKVYPQHIIEGVDIDSFELISSSFARDKNNVYFKGRQLSGAADPISYEYLGWTYGKDKNNVYNGNKILEGIVNPESYEHLSSRYGKDESTVYYMENGTAKIIEGADSDSFQKYQGNGFYAQDKDYIYRYGRIEKSKNKKDS